ncbi:MAG TPA: PaaI family thioesterase [Hyphomonadaceae bacterium]|nr:PaaI family thioesterase [Hyphomonadaceae bacterium]
MDRTQSHTVTWEQWAPPPEWAQLSGLEQMRKAIEARAPRAPIAALLDMRMTSVEEGVCRFDAWPGPQHVNPIGVVHGGFAATVLDAACWTAVMTTNGPGETHTTLDLKVNYVRAITPETGPVVCDGRVVNRGGRIALAEAKIMDKNGKLLAHATSTLMIIRS